MADLRFDVTAHDDASGEFLAIAAQLKALAGQLRDLDGRKARANVALAGAEKAQAQARQVRTDVDSIDGRKARVRVSLDAASSAPVTALARSVESLDGKIARARVDLAGAEVAEAKVTGLVARLRALPAAVRTRIDVELDRSAGERLAAVSAGLQRIGSVAGSAAAGVSRFRAIAKVIVDPAQLPVIARVSDAIATRFHSAVDVARVGVDRLGTGLKVLHGSMLALGAVGNAGQVIGGLAASVAQLSGVALLAPAALLGVGVAVGTVKAAFAGFGDAVNAEDLEEFLEATKDMDPAARQTAAAVRSVKQEFLGVQQAIQATLFAGLAQQVQSLGRTYLPILKTGLAGVGEQLNGVARSAGTALTSFAAVGNVRTVIANTTTALGAMRDSVANAATGFLTLGAAGSAWLPRIGAAIDSAAAKFDAWASRITSDGTFDRWVNAGITALKQLGTILGNLGSITATVFSALNQGGQGLLGTLAGLTTQLRQFLASAEGAAALRSLGQTLTVAGDALSRVFGAALRALGPVLSSLAPLVQAFAAAIGDHLVSLINLAAPAIQRLAQALAANPELLLTLAKAAAAVVLGFGPMVAIIGVAASVLKGLLLARLVGVAMASLGVAGGVAARILTALVSPLALLRELFPLIARGVGYLAASLGLAAGPIGALIVGFATLYATSSQFRDAANQIGATIGRLFGQALQDAGQIIASTVEMIGQFVDIVGQAAGGLASFGSTVASVFGPLGSLVSGALSGLFDVLGKLPGAALAAFAAFRLFGMITPIFAAASAAVAGFSARMLAFQSASGVATAAANGVGAATGRLSTALSKLGSALPLIGVALIAAGFFYDSVRDKSTDAAEAVVAGSASMRQAIQQQVAALESQDFWFSLSSDSANDAEMAQRRYASAAESVRAAVEQQVSQLGPLEQAQARVRISQDNLNDAILTFGATSPQAGEAARVLARDKADLAAKEQTLEEATRDTTAALRDQVSAAQSLLGANADLESSLTRVADAQKAASDAAKQHGENSAEAVAAGKEFAVAADQAAQAAQRQAESLARARGATDGAEQGTQAYAATLLQLAANASGPARTALLGNLAALDQTTLDSLSAAAATSGFATQVLQLPDGKTVTIAVDPQTGKIVDTKVLLDSIQDKTVVINGDTIPFETSVRDGVGAALAMSPTLPVDGNTAPFNGKVTASVAFADGSTGTITLDGQPAPVNGKIQQAVVFADGSRGTITIDGNPNPVTGKVTASVQYANGSTGTITLNPRDLVTPTINRLSQGSSSTHTIFVRTVGDGVRATTGGGGYIPERAEGAITTPGPAYYAMGGIRPMSAARAEIVPARQPRIIGDRMRGDEFFLPDDDTRRSMAIGLEWVRRRGLRLMPPQRMSRDLPVATPLPGSGGSPVQMRVRPGMAERRAGAMSLAPIAAAVTAANGALAQKLDALTALLRDRPQQVINQTIPGGRDPVETGRTAALALRLARS